MSIATITETRTSIHSRNIICVGLRDINPEMLCIVEIDIVEIDIVEIDISLFSGNHYTFFHKIYIKIYKFTCQFVLRSY